MRAARTADDLRLVNAAKRNDPAAVRLLLAEGLDIDVRHPDGATALLWTTHYDDAGTAALVIAAGADVDAANDYGESPLTQASRNGNATLVGALLVAGADPHAVKPTGDTLLMTTPRAGSGAVVDLLLAAAWRSTPGPRTRPRRAPPAVLPHPAGALRLFSSVRPARPARLDPPARPASAPCRRQPGSRIVFGYRVWAEVSIF